MSPRSPLLLYRLILAQQIVVIFFYGSISTTVSNTTSVSTTAAPSMAVLKSDEESSEFQPALGQHEASPFRGFSPSTISSLPSFLYSNTSKNATMTTDSVHPGSDATLSQNTTSIITKSLNTSTATHTAMDVLWPNATLTQNATTSLSTPRNFSSTANSSMGSQTWPLLLLNCMS
jgi:hypothetical protein